MSNQYPKIAQLKTVHDFRTRLSELKLELPCDDSILTAEQDSPLAAAMQVGKLHCGNRWCIHPMEGWDANTDGSPSEHTIRRWRNFGLSGAKLIWGGEAAAVRPDGRANPNQTLATPANKAGLADLLAACRNAHIDRFENNDDLVVGLQLTHSGRFCRPNSKELQSRIAYHHPLLDAKFGIDPGDDSVVFTDSEIHELIDAYVASARLAAEVGYQFVDVKACHGYLLHEFLSAHTREGAFGGDLAGRSNVLRTIIERIRSEIPQLEVVVRLSVFDFPPFATSRDVGEPMNYADCMPYYYAFGASPDDPLQVDLTEPISLLRMLQNLGVAAVNLSCGSPYYNPHIQRPAIFPPSDGYQPPEDPLVGVVRQIAVARDCKQAIPDLLMVGTAYTYLQNYLPHVAQAVVREGWIDSVGLGRMVLSYPDMPADVLESGELKRKAICRTFSDCTTAPRHGVVSGCYPLDSYYKDMPAADQVKAIKQKLKETR